MTDRSSRTSFYTASLRLIQMNKPISCTTSEQNLCSSNYLYSSIKLLSIPRSSPWCSLCPPADPPENFLNQHFHSNLTKSFTTLEIMRWPKVEEIYKAELQKTAVFSDSKRKDSDDRWAVFHKRIVQHVRQFSFSSKICSHGVPYQQHTPTAKIEKSYWLLDFTLQCCFTLLPVHQNIRVISHHYTKISSQKLAELLDLGQDVVSLFSCISWPISTRSCTPLSSLYLLWHYFLGNGGICIRSCRARSNSSQDQSPCADDKFQAKCWARRISAVLAVRCQWIAGQCGASHALNRSWGGIFSFFVWRLDQRCRLVLFASPCRWLIQSYCAVPRWCTRYRYQSSGIQELPRLTQSDVPSAMWEKMQRKKKHPLFLHVNLLPSFLSSVVLALLKIVEISRWFPF